MSSPTDSSANCNITTWYEAFLDDATRVAQTTFRPALRSAGAMWDACEDVYGTGTGYRDAVATLVRNWFEEQARAPLHDLVEEHVQRSWLASEHCLWEPIVRNILDYSACESGLAS